MPSWRANTSPDRSWPGRPSRTFKSSRRVDIENIEAAIKGDDGMGESAHRNSIRTELGETTEALRFYASRKLDFNSGNRGTENFHHALGCSWRQIIEQNTR